MQVPWGICLTRGRENRFILCTCSPKCHVQRLWSLYSSHNRRLCTWNNVFLTDSLIFFSVAYRTTLSAETVEKRRRVPMGNFFAREKKPLRVLAFGNSQTNPGLRTSLYRLRAMGFIKGGIVTTCATKGFYMEKATVMQDTSAGFAPLEIKSWVCTLPFIVQILYENALLNKSRYTNPALAHTSH